MLSSYFLKAVYQFITSPGSLCPLQFLRFNYRTIEYPHSQMPADTCTLTKPHAALTKNQIIPLQVSMSLISEKISSLLFIKSFPFESLS